MTKTTKLTTLEIEVLSCLPLDPIPAFLRDIAQTVMGNLRTESIAAIEDAIASIRNAGIQLRKRTVKDAWRQQYGYKRGWCIDRESWQTVKELLADWKPEDENAGITL